MTEVELEEQDLDLLPKEGQMELAAIERLLD